MGIFEIFGYLGALIVGLVLGLIGGGGSILTVPIMVYLLAVNPITATAYSLFVVGTTSLVGAIKNIRKKRVDLRTAFVFATPAFLTVYATRRYLVPAIPDTLFTIFDFEITKDIGIMIFFSIIMMISAISMIFNNQVEPDEDEKIVYNYPQIILKGIGIGLLTGLVGAGGGFLIIPALVLLVKLPMKRAVATSLLIIAINSLIGFIGDIQNMEIDWIFLFIFSGLSIVGIFLGIYLNRFINGKKLKKAFGWFVLVMGIYIMWKELSA